MLGEAKHVADLKERKVRGVIYKAWARWFTSLWNIYCRSVSKCASQLFGLLVSSLGHLLDATLQFNLSMHLEALVEQDFIGRLNNCYFLLYLDRHHGELYILQLGTTQHPLYHLTLPYC